MSAKKSTQLGINYGTATHRLRKRVMFSLLVKLGENVCFQCSKTIDSPDTLSLEHKEPWLGADNDLFWSLDNIAFSHLSCNSRMARSHNKGVHKHPSVSSYIHRKCRCEGCRKEVRLKEYRYRSKKK